MKLILQKHHSSSTQHIKAIKVATPNWEYWDTPQNITDISKSVSYCSYMSHPIHRNVRIHSSKAFSSSLEQSLQSYYWKLATEENNPRGNVLTIYQQAYVWQVYDIIFTCVFLPKLQKYILKLFSFTNCVTPIG